MDIDFTVTLIACAVSYLVFNLVFDFLNSKRLEKEKKEKEND